MSEVEIDSAANAGMETKKMARVPQEYIDWLIEGFKLRPPGPVRGITELLSKLGDGDDPLRKTLEEAAAVFKRVQDAELDIVAQYRAKGYAEVEVE